MASNLDIDYNLLEEAQKIGGHKTKKATVNEALAEYIHRHRQSEIPELFGKLEWNPEYDYKKERSRG
ncbi:MAG: type II toxin-antitoxin system VapB family antitoxin [bacterium]|nr:type II toxin-antitoxin system VapB family antitoxin [bacterium]